MEKTEAFALCVMNMSKYEVLTATTIIAPISSQYLAFLLQLSTVLNVWDGFQTSARTSASNKVNKETRLVDDDHLFCVCQESTLSVSKIFL